MFDIKGSTTTPKNKLEKFGVGEYPYVTTQAIQNGINGYYNFYTEKGHCLTIDSAVLGVCFYQEKEFSASDHVEVLRPKFSMSKNTALFFCVILNKMRQILGYKYDKKRSQKAMKQEKIFLPIISKDKPDWEFMENYIKKSKKDIEKLLTTYRALDCNGGGGLLSSNLLKDLNCEWGKFKIGELFSVKSNPQLNKSSFKFVENREYPYFTRKVYNNGILGYVKYLDEEHKIKGNSIAVGLIAMRFFYMQKDFYAGQFTKTIYPKFKGFNKNIALFFTTLFNANKKQYLKNFIVKDFEKDFLNTNILLPIDSKGSPNFTLMESFIKNIQAKTNSLL